MITAELLTRIPLFARIPPNELASLAGRAADVRLHQNEWLILEGQTPAFFGLLEGRLALHKNIGGHDQQLATYEPGEYFGEVPLLLASQRSRASGPSSPPALCDSIQPTSTISSRTAKC